MKQCGQIHGLLLLLLIGLMGCKPERLVYVVEQRQANGEYQVTKRISRSNQVDELIALLDATEPATNEPDNQAQADFLLYLDETQLKTPEKAGVSSLWLTKEKTLAVVNSETNGMVRLNQADSQRLYELLTGEKLKKFAR